jgi:hypothetical protein
MVVPRILTRAVRAEGADHQWRTAPSRELSIALAATSGLVGQPAGSKPREEGCLGRLGNPAGRALRLEWAPEPLTPRVARGPTQGESRDLVAERSSARGDAGAAAASRARMPRSSGARDLARVRRRSAPDRCRSRRLCASTFSAASNFVTPSQTGASPAGPSTNLGERFARSARERLVGKAWEMALRRAIAAVFFYLH